MKKNPSDYASSASHLSRMSHNVPSVRPDQDACSLPEILQTETVRRCRRRISGTYRTYGTYRTKVDRMANSFSADLLWCGSRPPVQRMKKSSDYASSTGCAKRTSLGRLNCADACLPPTGKHWFCFTLWRLNCACRLSASSLAGTFKRCRRRISGTYRTYETYRTKVDRMANSFSADLLWCGSRPPVQRMKKNLLITPHPRPTGP